MYKLTDWPFAHILVLIVIGAIIEIVMHTCHALQACKWFGVHDYRYALNREYEIPGLPSGTGRDPGKLSRSDEAVVCIKCGKLIENPRWDEAKN